MPTARWHQGADFARTVSSNSFVLGSFIVRPRVIGALSAALLVSRLGLAQEAPVVDPAAAVTDAPATEAPPASAEPVEEVSVRGDPLVQAGSKLREPRRDIPATVNLVTREQLNERAINDLPTALNQVPGMNAVLTYGGFNAIQIRGFGDFVILRDGVRDDRSTVADSSPWTNLADVQRIEVLKGPASVLYGFGGIGGVINIVRTRPSDSFTYDASVTAGGPKFTRRASLGIGGPIVDDTLAYRLDVGLSDDTDFRRTRQERNSFSGALEFRPSEAQRLLVRANFSRDRYNTDAGVPTVDGRIPDGIARDRRFNTPQDQLTYRWYEVSAEYSLRLASWLRLVDRLSYVRNPYNYLSAEGLYPTEDNTVEREYLFFGHDWRPLYNQLELEAEHDVVVPQRMLLGYEFGWMHSTHPGSTESDYAAMLPVPFERIPDPQPEVGVIRDRRRVRDQITHGVYFHDTLTVLPELKLVLGVRADFWSRETRTDTLSLDVPGAFVRGTEQERDASAVTWRAGLVYQPIDWVSVYASAATAFVPVATVPADGTQLDPERGRQFELGARFDLARYLHLDIAGFDILKSDVVVARPEGLYAQAGRVSSRGIELGAELAHPTGVGLKAGYAFTHVRYEDFITGDVDYSGKSPPFVPEHGFTFWGTYRHASGLGAGLGLRAMSEAYGDPANEVPLPAYGVFDAALYYRFAPAELSLNVSNLFDNEKYLTGSINDSQVYPGAPRVALVSLRVSQ